MGIDTHFFIEIESLLCSLKLAISKEFIEIQGAGLKLNPVLESNILLAALLVKCKK